MEWNASNLLAYQNFVSAPGVFCFYKVVFFLRIFWFPPLLLNGGCNLLLYCTAITYMAYTDCNVLVDKHGITFADPWLFLIIEV